MNNAGIVALGQSKKFDLAKWQKVIDVNLTGTFLGMRASIDPMIAAGAARSSTCRRSRACAVPRGASVCGLQVGGTRIVQIRGTGLARHNIRVNSIHPGFVRTPMTKHLPDDMVTIPLGRPAESIEVSTFVLFLASDESSYATGSEFIIDGGLVTDVPHKDF